jgi:predicted MFS family arabinose efflux permease
MLLLVRTVVTAPTSGWGSASIVGGFVVTAALLALFIVIEQRSAHPLVRLGILRSGALVRANIGGAAMFGSYIGFQFIGTLYMQQILGWSSLTTALAFLPAGLVVVLGSTRIAPIVNRFGTARLIVLAFASLVVGYLLFMRIGDRPEYLAVILPTMLFLGIGFALGFPSLNIQATAGVRDHEQGLASGLLNTSFQLGGAVGLAVITAVVISNTGAGAGAHSVLAGYRPGLAVAAVIGALGLLVAVGALAAWPARRAALADDGFDDVKELDEFAELEPAEG